MADKETLERHLEEQTARRNQALKAGDDDTVAASSKVIAQIKRDLKVFGVTVTDGGDAGGGGGGSPIGKADEQEALAKMYDRLSGADLYRLYNEDRETWQKVMDAKEKAGWKKLGL